MSKDRRLKSVEDVLQEKNLIVEYQVKSLKA